jgi:DNA-binding transcriptional regulator YiaG
MTAAEKLKAKREAYRAELAAVREERLEEHRESGKGTLMSPLEYQRSAEKLGLDSFAAAKLFGVSHRTVLRWGYGEAPVPDSVAHLMWLMLKTNYLPDDLMKNPRKAAA